MTAAMSKTRENILKSAMQLSESDRLLLATELMETVSDDLPGWALDDPGLIAELESRANDGSEGVLWESVQAQLRADLDA
jgi:hypothetical protein